MVFGRLRRNASLLQVGADCMLSFGPPSHPESKGPGEVAALPWARDFAVSGTQRPRSAVDGVIPPDGVAAVRRRTADIHVGSCPRNELSRPSRGDAVCWNPYRLIRLVDKLARIIFGYFVRSHATTDHHSDFCTAYPFPERMLHDRARRLRGARAVTYR